MGLALFPSHMAAEGLGFAGLAPFMQIWKKLRDIAFLIIALAVIFSGFMIMFRGKMDPHSEIKLETALPKIIIAMLLIHFSFAIAGLLIDVMYILSGMIIVIFGPLVSPNLSLSSMLDRYVSPGTLDLFHLSVGNFEGHPLGFITGVIRIVHDLPYAVYGIFGDVYRDILMFFTGTLLAISGTISFYKFLKDYFTTPLQTQVIPFIISVVAMFIVWNALYKLGGLLAIWVLGVFFLATAAYVAIQLFALSFAAYIKVLFYVMLSPLLLVTEALPGSNVFIPWVQTLFVELLTFPLILLIFLLSGAFSNAISNGQALGLPFVSAINPEGLGIIVSFGILFMTPELVKGIKEKLNTQSISVPALNPGVLFKGPLAAKPLVTTHAGFAFMKEMKESKGLRPWQALKKAYVAKHTSSPSH
ncbi:MAG: hypothetical protein UZ22_OP11002000332 [Microgenomates bacterium OLB23]|nr:MAG: hypothetical protein UZ22_OP11002000332 [Microgenomates bacterium OLB23]